MNWSCLPPYGHACCPHCCQEFNLMKANPTFQEKAPHNDTLVYVMCPDCHKVFQNGDAEVRKQMANVCFVNFKLYGYSSEHGMPPFSITTTLTLALNDWHLTAAIEDGHGLTQAEYVSICSQAYEITVLPGGVRIINSSPQTGADDEQH